MSKQRPKRRINPSGKTAWVARYKDRNGEWQIAKPSWNNGKGTFALKRDAQKAIDEAVGGPTRQGTVRTYLEPWIESHPRSERTNRTNRSKIKAALDIEIDGLHFGDYPMGELDRYHTSKLIGGLLAQGRAAQGVRGTLGSLSVLFEDAITDGLAKNNPVLGVKVRSNDPRVAKAKRKIRVWTFDQMREFAAAGRAEVRAQTRRPEYEERMEALRKKGTLRHGEPEEFFSEINYEPMLLTIALTGLRLGEVLALRKTQLSQGLLHPTGTAWNGKIVEGDSNEKVHVRPVPCPASLEFAIRQSPIGPRSSKVLFATEKGTVWSESNFRRQVWRAAQIATGMDIRPHECRHSYVTHLRAEGVDDADLAQVAGHRVETMLAHYAHPLGQSFERIREIIG